ncbi:hypothetical protein H702_09295 [Streptococcus equinus JB1]|uniref:Uncharacterized protein n=1 Tax=Streptococcus equinus JB1 TaxID=1294274 RepID=A0A091BN81_STREI|nr:DUF1366 domain-containing protein [Streptococcus equinus]KFN85880.1 hypothetical protein H702_09295 [Streptococcus equinus JB1]QBX24780.1 hypothetical protein Javan206_0045 [Streptococcus phage Javan206]SFL20802.1 Protein of unknown function [Streptococcus equinus JB1]
MKLSFNSKSQEIGLDGSVAGTRVVLSNNDGGFLPVMLPAEKISLSNAELEELALEVVYRENFPRRAENEKFNEIGEKIAKYDEMIEKMQKAIDDSEKMTKLATATLNGLINQMYADEETADETVKEN